MSYVPKETLYLARHAKAEIPLSRTEHALLKLLECTAESGRRSSGVVDPSVARIREALIAGQVPEAPWGRIEESRDGSLVIINSVTRKLRPGQHGVIERTDSNGSSVTIGGWAADRKRHERPKMVHIFDMGILIDTIQPNIVRPEFGIEGPVGFETMVSLHDRSTLKIVAEFSDRTVGLVEQPS